MLALVVQSSVAAANLISNGSFELGNFVPPKDDTMIVYAGDSNITGWEVTQNAVGWIGASNPWSVIAPDGNNVIDLTDYPPGPPFGGLRQSIATISGQSYLLTFDLGHQNFVSASQVAVSASNTSLTFTSSDINDGSIWAWETLSLLFTAQGATTFVSFEGVGSNGTGFVGIDNVSVISAVPVPAAAWLFASGLIALASLAKRKGI